MHPFLQTVGICLLICPALSAEEPRRASTHYAFRPITAPKVPDGRGVCRTDVDRFILSALEAKRLALNPEADRATLIRRVCFDLTGLPPSVAEIDAFLADRSMDAYEKMIDRYLASPRYGERWGKLWLDAAGYADSNGYFNADSDRPLAWRYRDYVIKAFNDDKPYDRFVREQLSGDELVNFIPGRDVTPAMIDPLIATHFLRNAPDGSGESDGNPDEVRTDRFTVLEGNVQNMMNCLLGITIQCARCHDHKFEPVTQEEYYSLQAIFFPVYNPERWSKPNERVVNIGTVDETAARKLRNEQITRQVKAAKDGLAAFSESLQEQVIAERLKALPSAERDSVLEAFRAAKNKRSAAQQALLKKHAKTVEISDDELAVRFPEYAALRERVKLTIAEREKDRRAVDQISAFVETDAKPLPHHVLLRGQHGQPGKEVKPGVPAAFSTQSNAFHIQPMPKGTISSGRRTALAHWVTSADNPLFARVMVNRIWQHHFGTGLVSTPENLGISGAKPSHPELLDYLASEFIRQKWSVKSMQRLIMTSAVYRQSSSPRDGLNAIDPDNRLLARFPLRRLDAEMIRDAMLDVSGELDLKMGGPYVPTKRTAEGVVEAANAASVRRRSVYLQQRRTQVDTFLQLFDAPSVVNTCGKRSPSTVPLQSLVLLNSDFARQQAKNAALRLTRETGADSRKRLSLAFKLMAAREPTNDERAACEKFLQKQQMIYAKEKDVFDRAWADLCQMLLASNTFLYLE